MVLTIKAKKINVPFFLKGKVDGALEYSQLISADISAGHSPTTAVVLFSN